jgi:hypothetical protein
MLFCRHILTLCVLFTQTLSMEGALELDEEVRAAAARGERTPHDEFSVTRFRQPALNEGKLKPSLYRKGKPMLPDTVGGPRPEAFIQHSGAGSSSTGATPQAPPDSARDVEAARFGAQSTPVVSPIHPRTGVAAYLTPAGRERASSAFEGDDEDDFDAEDGDKDLEVAVNDLLQDENNRSAVNLVSEQISSIRRSSLIGINSTARNSSLEDSLEDGAELKVHSFTSNDLESSLGGLEERQVRR